MGDRRRRKNNSTIAVLASGGTDSACLLEWAAARTTGSVIPIYVSFGLRWEFGELKALRSYVREAAKHNKKIRVPVKLNMPARDIYDGHWSLTGKDVPGRRSADAAVYLPGRNLLVLSKAAVYCAKHRIDEIAIGTLAANPFSDATSAFFSSFSKLASDALGRRVRILAPFIRQTKVDIIRKYSYLPLHLCFSCLRPMGRAAKPCGRCNKCVEWRKAWRQLLTRPGG